MSGQERERSPLPASRACNDVRCLELDLGRQLELYECFRRFDFYRGQVQGGHCVGDNHRGCQEVR